MLELINISKSYSAGDHLKPEIVLNGVSLKVAAGDSIAITGPSGSGKSTLLNLIGGLDRPTGGEVVVNGQDITQLDDKKLAAIRNRQIGFVFQLHHLLPQCTVLENVLVPSLISADTGDNATERASMLLERVGLADYVNRRPGELSGGQRQRVAVVRAMINKPGLLLADEPTGALDKAASDNLIELLTELNRDEGVTLIVATHSGQLAGAMGKTYEITEGGIHTV